jgi:hypothetical protein
VMYFKIYFKDRTRQVCWHVAGHCEGDKGNFNDCKGFGLNNCRIELPSSEMGKVGQKHIWVRKSKTHQV